VTIYSKPSVRSTWGQTASGSDLQDPGDTYASAGWQLGQKPPRQYFNWVLNYVSQGIRYLCQQGISNWDPNETYSPTSYVNSPGNLLYRGVANSTNQNPDSTFGVAWDVPSVNTAPLGDNSTRIANTIWIHENFIPIGATFNSIQGSINPGQVGVGSVTQWQGSLTLSGAQIASAVSQANTLQLVGAGFATFFWSGLSGQPTWLLGSNNGTSFNVYNPSNFSVANATLLNNVAGNIQAVGNTIPIRDSNAYLYAAYFNQNSGNNENPAINQIIVTNGSDGFFRKASAGAVAAALAAQGLTTNASFPNSLGTNGYQKLPSGFIIQWGYASTPSSPGAPVDIAISFPTSFPTFCAAVMVATNRSEGTSGPAVDGSNFSSNYSNGGCTITVDNIPGGSGGHWFAVGW
jgi:hypothetical protein